MKKMGILLLSALLLNTSALAESRTSKGLTDAEKFAIMAGAAQACNADQDKLINYEVIVSRILVNPTKSSQEETAALTAYARKKFQVYTEQKQKPEMACDEVLRRFDNQPIFKAVVYQDGTVKLPDGKTIKPERPIIIENASVPVAKAAPMEKKAALTPASAPAAAPKPASKKPFRPGVIVNKF